MNTKYRKREDITNELQKLQAETKLKFKRTLSKIYDEKNCYCFRHCGIFHFEEDILVKMQEVWLV